jgi:uncharacterized protein YqhQ
MMRAPRSLAIAVRRPDGTIVVREDAWVSIWERLTFLRWPLIRGSVVLVESLYNGIQALNFSASQVEPESSAEGRKAGSNGATATATATATSRAGTRSSSSGAPSSEARGIGSRAGTIALSFALAIALFVGLPHLLTWGAAGVTGIQLDLESFGFHLVDGIFKILIFVGYIVGISRIPEIRRVFQYHGAEHKVVNAYENGEALTVENARHWTTFHARCGTSFVLFVLVLSIFMFAAVFPFVPKVSSVALLNHAAMIAIKVPMMLPLSGIAYEINRYASKHPGQLWVQSIVLPGRLMQKLTTREPTDDQLEIALSAMRAALRREAELKAIDSTEALAIARRQPVGGQVVVFRDFGELASAIPSSVL